jgi:hypothetical protein
VFKWLEWRLVVAKEQCIGARIKLEEEEEEEDILPHPAIPSRNTNP